MSEALDIAADWDPTAILEALGAVSEAANKDPLEQIELTLAQLAFVAMVGPRLLWRGANQIGKSFGIAFKMLCFLLALQVYKHRRKGPVRILVLSTSKEQMIPLMEKLWAMLPRGDVCRSLRRKGGRTIIEPLEFVDGFGFTGKPPRIYFHSGPAKGSLVQFATYKQGSGRIAGGTFDLVILDEPPPEKVWGEVLPRVMSKGGDIWVTFTPTPDSPDLKYMRDLVKMGPEKPGGIKELHTELTVEAMTLPATPYRPARHLKSQRQIDEYAASILPAEADMRLRGGWDIIVTERLFMGWNPTCLAPDSERPPAHATLMIGGDHGSAPGRQAFALIAAWDLHSPLPSALVLNCYQPAGFTTSEMDADGILRMIRETGERHGIVLGYDDIDRWVCDRASGTHEHGVRKSNDRLQRYLARAMDRPQESLKPIDTPIKHGRSVSEGQTMMNNMMGRRRGDGRSYFRVWSGCEKWIASVQRYRGVAKDPAKDLMDATRYPLEAAIGPAPAPSGVSMLYA